MFGCTCWGSCIVVVERVGGKLVGDGLAKGIDGFVKKFGHRGGCWVGTVEVCTNWEWEGGV